MDVIAGEDTGINITPSALVSKLSSSAPPVLRRLVEEWGDAIIFKMRVVRVPISQAIETLANIATFGKFKKTKARLDIDRYFHLFIEMAFYKLDENGERIIQMALVEKNQRVNVIMDRPGGLGQGETAILVPLNRSDLTVAEFFENAENSVGGERLYIYEATTYNCQRFVADLLQANGLWTSDMESFVLQDVSTAVPNYLKSVMGLATNTANRIQAFLRGRGRYR